MKKAWYLYFLYIDEANKDSRYKCWYVLVFCLLAKKIACDMCFMAQIKLICFSLYMSIDLDGKV